MTQAVKEYDDLGGKKFLGRYGYKVRRRYFVAIERRLYVAQALVEVALGRGPVVDTSAEERLGAADEEAACNALRRLGYTIVDGWPQTVAGEKELRLAAWAHLRDLSQGRSLAPQELRDVYCYFGQAGIWRDHKRTKEIGGGQVDLGSDGIAVGVLHTGKSYADDLSDRRLNYHYPVTERPGQDRAEIASLKVAARLKLPVFVSLTAEGNKSRRDVRLSWVTGWDDESRIFFLSFKQDPPDNLKTADDSDDRPFVLRNARKRRVKRSVVERPDQPTFKADVYLRYGARCPLSGIRVKQMLDAAHIIPFAEDGTSDPRNGIPMNAALHRAFDADLFAINPDTLKIELASGEFTLADMGIIHDGIDGLDKKPHLDALRWRYEKWLELIGKKPKK
ncbi:HNH endonuclease [Crossiella sp. CA198]|uniref:HNH endonuclease n=1 Tax=Crossiella sp. CA198 TaxID=3455607 RepID=UPI003F8D52AE